VVIPSVNGAVHLRRVLATLRPPAGGGLEVLVVDGGSTDGSRAACAAAPVPVRFLSTGHNLGYAAAANAGLRAARGRHLLVLNNDTEAAPDLLDRLLGAARDSGAALIVPRVLTLDGDARVDNTGHRLYRDGLNLCRERGEPADDLRGRVPVPPLLPSGAAVLLRRDALARIGGFDEGFFAYGEDAELGMRALRAGLSIHYAPDAVVRHLGGGTWGPASVRKAYLVERNRARLAVAHLPWRQLAASPWHWLARYAEHARAREEGPLGAYPGRWQQGAAALGAAAGVAAAVAGLPGDMRRRARTRAQATLSDEQFETLLRRSLVGRSALRRRTRW